MAVVSGEDGNGVQSPSNVDAAATPDSTVEVATAAPANPSTQESVPTASETSSAQASQNESDAQHPSTLPRLRETESGLFVPEPPMPILSSQMVMHYCALSTQLAEVSPSGFGYGYYHPGQSTTSYMDPTLFHHDSGGQTQYSDYPQSTTMTQMTYMQSLQYGFPNFGQTNFPAYFQPIGPVPYSGPVFFAGSAPITTVPRILYSVRDYSYTRQSQMVGSSGPEGSQGVFAGQVPFPPIDPQLQNSPSLFPERNQPRMRAGAIARDIQSSSGGKHGRKHGSTHKSRSKSEGQTGDMSKPSGSQYQDRSTATTSSVAAATDPSAAAVTDPSAADVATTSSATSTSNVTPISNITITSQVGTAPNGRRGRFRCFTTIVSKSESTDNMTSPQSRNIQIASSSQVSGHVERRAARGTGVTWADIAASTPNSQKQSSKKSQGTSVREMKSCSSFAAASTIVNDGASTSTAPAATTISVATTPTTTATATSTSATGTTVAAASTSASAVIATTSTAAITYAAAADANVSTSTAATAGGSQSSQAATSSGRGKRSDRRHSKSSQNRQQQPQDLEEVELQLERTALRNALEVLKDKDEE